MKVLAIVDVVPGSDLQALRAELPHEVRGSWELFTKGVIREAYATAEPTRVVFVLEAEDAADAKATLEKLPLLERGLLKAQYVELRPFVNWAMLFAR
jgi:hypothetical protein